MAIWAIADLHASAIDRESGLPTKPMDVFGASWRDHLRRMTAAWTRSVSPEDTVLVVGDIDWALRLDDAADTLRLLDGLPGSKVLVRGNHDYWWSSKTTNRVRAALPGSVELLHNNSFQREGFNLCGTKGSAVPGSIEWTAENEKILHRELGRLETSLRARDPRLPTIVALHYPPFFRGLMESPYRAAIDAVGASACVYGHLHGDAGAAGPKGRFGATEYFLVAGDSIGFEPELIASAGVVQRGGVAT